MCLSQGSNADAFGIRRKSVGQVRSRFPVKQPILTIWSSVNAVNIEIFRKHFWLLSETPVDGQHPPVPVLGLTVTDRQCIVGSVWLDLTDPPSLRFSDSLNFFHSPRFDETSWLCPLKRRICASGIASTQQNGLANTRSDREGVA